MFYGSFLAWKSRGQHLRPPSLSSPDSHRNTRIIKNNAADGARAVRRGLLKPGSTGLSFRSLKKLAKPAW
jgi:hypothetical protein